jgi:hypothetical protein
MADVIDIYREALALLGEKRLASTSEDISSRYALDDAYSAAVTYVLRSAPWRFALKTAALSAGGSAISGYSISSVKPNDWLRTHAIFVLSGSRECPIDCREQDTHVFSNVTPTLRYVASGIAITTFPEQIVKAVTAYLAFLTAERITGDPNLAQDMFALWQRNFNDALRTDAVPENPWLEHQLDGSFLASSKLVLQAGNWRFAVKRALLVAEVSGSPLPGFSASYAKPADWVRTQALYVRSGVRECPIDAREHGTRWSANVAPTLSYVSTDGLAATLWPEDFMRAVAAHLGLYWGDNGARLAKPDEKQSIQALWPQYLQSALLREADPDSPWLAFQFSGAFRNAAQFILEKAFWRFALKTATLADTTGTPAPGFTYNFNLPSDHIKTQSLFAISATRECPLDARETDGQISSNLAAPTLRYLSNAAVTDATTWSELFEKTVAAYLGIELQPSGQASQNSEAFAQWTAYLAAAASVEAIDQSPWLRFQYDGTFLEKSKLVLSAGLWRFALKEVALADSGSGSPAPGYSYNFAKPADWVKTQAFFARSGIKECPIDIRETDDQYSGNVAAPVLRYVSSAYLIATTWPAPFLKAVGACLGLEVSDRGEAKKGAPDASPWQEAVALALSLEGMAESSWLPAQLDGRFDRSSRFVLEQVFWKFALKDALLVADVSPAPLAGFTYSFSFPATWLRTQAFYRRSGTREFPLDAREHGAKWSSNYATPVVRYLSSDGLDSTLWPEQFNKTVAAHLGINQGDNVIAPNGASVPNWPQYLKEALRAEAIDVDPWLVFQFDGSLYRCSRDLLSKGFWRFAVKTVSLTGSTTTPSDGFAYKFTKPADFVRVFTAGYQHGSGWGSELETLGFRDEGGYLHANQTPLQLRYISSDGFEPNTWSDSFEAALLAYLQYDHAKNSRDFSAAEIQVREQAFKSAFSVARKNDDISERPKVFSAGTLVAARMGGRVRATREQGW